MSLLVAPGLTTRNKKLLGAKGIVTSSKDATRNLFRFVECRCAGIC